MTARQLAEQAGYAMTGYGELISVAELLQVAGEAEIVRVVLNDPRGVLAFGRTARFASSGQRLALAARDHGCSFPECTRPPAWCEAHHVTPWHLGGSTELNNLTLLCGFHHREFERRGWIVRMCEGVPMWIPPPWLDPEQQPRPDTAHHLDDIEFAYAA